MNSADTRDGYASVHRSAIEALAADSHAPIELVEKLYRSEITTLEPHATIQLYLPLIARRTVRAAPPQRQPSI